MWTFRLCLVLSCYTHCRVNTRCPSDSAGGPLRGGQWTGAIATLASDDLCRHQQNGRAHLPRMEWKIRRFTQPKPENAICRCWCPMPIAHLHVHSSTRSLFSYWLVLMSWKNTRERRDFKSLLSVSQMFSLLYLSFKKMFLLLTEVLSCLQNQLCQFCSSYTLGRDLLEAYLPSLPGTGLLSSRTQEIF